MNDLEKLFAIPVLVLQNSVVFPMMTMAFSTEQPLAIAAVNAALMRDDKMILVANQARGARPLTRLEDIATIGTTAVIKFMTQVEKRVHVVVQGIDRHQVVRFEQLEPYPLATVRPLPYTVDPGFDEELEALHREIMDLANKFLSHENPDIEIIFPKSIPVQSDILKLIFPLAQLFIHDQAKAQELLNAPSMLAALKVLQEILVHENQVIELRKQISRQAGETINREQREYLLRKQLHEIQQELGEQGSGETRLKELRQRLQEKNLPELARQEAVRALEHLERSSPAASDYHVTLVYLELIVELPWRESTTDNLDLGNARQVLNEDHYGLAEINERIIEHMAVMKLNPAAKAPILCFVGPPGVGKTSLGQSIAKALGRKFERFSLGGMHDEAELRGHRRTYVGALPGRIIQGIKRSGYNNPLLMLDEIDKVGRDFRGDPAAALMEILDPEQNFAFHDNYLDLPFDLSRVFFITTANTIDTIPRPLLDRMEIIRLSGYHEIEKKEIARRYLLPRQRREAGLKEEQFAISEESLSLVIRNYTREAGVRELERTLGRLARKVAVKFAEADHEPVTVEAEQLVDLLGPEKFQVEQTRKTLPVGVATGLAWTEAGGDIIYVEVIGLPENEKFTLTGQLGEVMKESAWAANSYARSYCEAIGVKKLAAPVHIHVPAGSIPKDGPSAGVTMVAALTSFYTKCPVRHDTAMTGEITLSGLVLPIGAVKEKILAAQRAGIQRVVLPLDNKKDFHNLPEYATRQMEFVFVETIPDLLAAVIPTMPRLSDKQIWGGLPEGAHQYMV